MSGLQILCIPETLALFHTGHHRHHHTQCKATGDLFHPLDWSTALADIGITQSAASFPACSSQTRARTIRQMSLPAETSLSDIPFSIGSSALSRRTTRRRIIGPSPAFWSIILISSSAVDSRMLQKGRTLLRLWAALECHGQSRKSCGTERHYRCDNKQQVRCLQTTGPPFRFLYFSRPSRKISPPKMSSAAMRGIRSIVSRLTDSQPSSGKAISSASRDVAGDELPRHRRRRRDRRRRFG